MYIMKFTFQINPLTTISIPISSENSNVIFTVDWKNENPIETYNTNDDNYNPSYTYTQGGTYEVEIQVQSGEVVTLGDKQWTSNQYLHAFSVENEVNWDMSSTTNGKLQSIAYLFSNAPLVKINGEVPSSLPDTVTSIEGLCAHETNENITASVPNKIMENWTLKNVENMAYAFSNVKIEPNTNKLSWNTGNAINMEGTFRGALFKQDAYGYDAHKLLDTLNVSNVENMKSLFEESNFNGTLTHWDVRKAQTMEAMFKGAFQFNDNIQYEKVNSLDHIQDYRNALQCWQPILCTNFSEMFMDASKYCGKITSWKLQTEKEIDFTNMTKNSLLNDYFQQLEDSPTIQDFNQSIPEMNTEKNAFYSNGLHQGEFVNMIYKSGYFNTMNTSSLFPLGRPVYMKYQILQNQIVLQDGTIEEVMFPTQVADYMSFLSVKTLDGENPIEESMDFNGGSYLGTKKDESIRFAKTLFQITNMFADGSEQEMFIKNPRIIIEQNGWLDKNKEKASFTYMQFKSTVTIDGITREATEEDIVVSGQGKKDIIDFSYEFITEELEKLEQQSAKYLFVPMSIIKDPEAWLTSLNIPSFDFPTEKASLALSNDNPLGKCTNLDNVESIPPSFEDEDLSGNKTTFTTGLYSIYMPFQEFNIFSGNRIVSSVEDIAEFFDKHLPLNEGNEEKHVPPVSFACGTPKIAGQPIYNQEMFDKAREEIAYFWTIMQGIYGGRAQKLALLQGCRVLYDEIGYKNKPLNGDKSKRVSFIQFEKDGDVTNHKNVDPNTLDDAVYLVTFYTNRKAVVGNDEDFKTYIDEWYQSRDENGDNPEGVTIANQTNTAGPPFFWKTYWSEFGHQRHITTLKDIFENRQGQHHPDTRYFNIQGIKDMTDAFKNSTFNGIIHTWERTLPDDFVNGSTFKNVTNTSSMFENAEQFNQNVSTLDVSSVTNMSSMFKNAVKFNNGGSNEIAYWDVDNCTNFSDMFYNAESFNRIIAKWPIKSKEENSKNINEEDVNVGDNPNLGPNLRQMVYNSKLYTDESDPFGQGFYKIAEGETDQDGNSLSGTPTYSLFGQTICFNKGTKILVWRGNQEVYVAVEELKKGDLVKTLNDGYKPIQSMTSGTYTLGRPIDMGMYKMKQEGSMMADLEMTGLHSILVDEKDHQEEIDNQLKNTCNRKIYCDNKFRLNVKYSNKFKKMSTQPYTIYTFSLEGPKNQYGIWANGVLVESTAEEVLRNQIMREHK